MPFERYTTVEYVVPEYRNHGVVRHLERGVVLASLNLAETGSVRRNEFHNRCMLCRWLIVLPTHVATNRQIDALYRRVDALYRVEALYETGSRRLQAPLQSVTTSRSGKPGVYDPFRPLLHSYEGQADPRIELTVLRAFREREQRYLPHWWQEPIPVPRYCHRLYVPLTSNQTTSYNLTLVEPGTILPGRIWISLKGSDDPTASLESRFVIRGVVAV